jgi:hypothetical protein
MRFARREGGWVQVDWDETGVELVHDGDVDGALGYQPNDEGCGIEDSEKDPYLEDAIDEALHPCRGDTGQSARSRMNMRRLFVSLPWELVGPWPALISLTYPGLWQWWVPDGRKWEAHRRAFERRWVRRWGEPLIGVWVKEFQASGRPHLHLYVGLPSALSDEEFAGLRDRTLIRHRLERQYGRYEGRKRTPPLGVHYGGEFAKWLLDAWSEIVGTNNSVGGPELQAALGNTDAHKLRGADVAVMFWSDEAEAKTNRTVVAQYLAREAGKWRQKTPPPDFVKIGRFFGVWGKTVGFQPETTTTALDALVAYEVEARLVRWVSWKLRVLRNGAPPSGALAARRRGDGVTAFGLGPDQAARILRWSETAAARKRANGTKRVAHDTDPADLVALLNSIDVETGEIVSPEGPARATGLTA